MLRRLGLGFFDGRILSRCRPSIDGIRRSIHNNLPSDSPPAAAAKHTAGWTMLNTYEAIRTNDPSVADANTIADLRTSTGRHLRVSLGRAAPPSSSFIYYSDLPGSSAPSEDDDEEEEVYVVPVMTHGDSVLLETSHRRSRFRSEGDYFLYRPGAAGGLPSLTLIPARDFLTKTEKVLEPYIHPPIGPTTVCSANTGLLRRGDDDDDALLVQLHLYYDRSLQRYMAEFCLLRIGAACQWELMESLPIIVQDDYCDGGGKGGSSKHIWTYCTDTTIPVGDRFLCMVGFESGLFLCDMAEVERPKVRYIDLPHELIHRRDGWDDQDDRDMKFSQSIGAAGVRAAVRLVSVDPYSCCFGSGGRSHTSTCAHPRYAFSIKSWTMNLSMEEQLTWVKDDEIDCQELWALPGYDGLPRPYLRSPIVSLDDPDVVCFSVSNLDFVSYQDYKVWMIPLNIKTKTLLSVVQFTKDPWRAYYHLPAKL